MGFGVRPRCSGVSDLTPSGSPRPRNSKAAPPQDESWDKAQHSRFDSPERGRLVSSPEKHASATPRPAEAG